MKNEKGSHFLAVILRRSVSDTLFQKNHLFLQYDVADTMARLLSKVPTWQSSSESDEEAIGRSFDNKADYLAERYVTLCEHITM